MHFVESDRARLSERTDYCTTKRAVEQHDDK